MCGKQFVVCALAVLLAVCLPFAECVRHGKIKKGVLSSSVRVVSSSSDGDALSVLDPIPLKSDFSSPYTLIVSNDFHYQTLLGFGGAITESSMSVFKSLSSANQAEILKAYYSSEGNAYTIGRIHMNSCDYSLNSYNFDDVDGDFNLDNFDTRVLHDVDNGIIDFTQKALNLSNGDLQLFFSPWSPPAWMKRNGKMTGSDQPCLKDGQQYRAAWANYFIKFLQAYKAHGINFWGFTVQNEPEYAAPWEACTWTAEEQRDFIKNNLGPAVTAYDPSLHIMIHDHNKDHVVQWAKTVLSDPLAAAYVWGTAVHWYSGDQFENVNLAHSLFPSKSILASEATLCPPANADNFSDWSRAEKYTHDILGDLNNWVVGWTDWNILLDLQGGPNHLQNWCDAAIRADVDSDEIFYQPMFYALGHFSKYLRPGSIRIFHGWELSKIPPTLELVAVFVPGDILAKTKKGKEAFHAGGEIVITVMNTGDKQVEWKLKLNTQAAAIKSPPHSIQSLFVDAALF